MEQNCYKYNEAFALSFVILLQWVKLNPGLVLGKLNNHPVLKKPYIPKTLEIKRFGEVR